LANSGIQAHKKSEDKKQYITMFRSEIDLSIKLLKKEELEILSVDQWTSAVNSGGLKLFDILELESLAKTYHHINKYNNHYKDLLNYNWNIIEDEIKQNAISLENELIELKNAEWFNPDARRKEWWAFWK
jgi:hypothetical protein